MFKYVFITLLMAGTLAGGYFAGQRYPDLVKVDGLLKKEVKQKPQIDTKITKVVAQGKLLPADGVRSVFAPPGQQIQEVLVTKGAQVVAGQTELLTFKSQNLLLLQQQLATSKKNDALKQLEQQRIKIENQITLAQAALSTAKLKADQVKQSELPNHIQEKMQLAKKQLARLKSLSEDTETRLFVSKSDIESLELEIKKGDQELKLAKQNADRLKQTADLAVKSAQAGLQAAQKSKASLGSLAEATASLDVGIELAKKQLEASRVFAPSSGTVLKVLARSGEGTTTFPVVQLGDLSVMQCEADVPDRLAKEVSVGDSVVMKSAAMNGPIQGVVREVAQTVGNGGLPNPNPLAPAEKQTVKVRIDISPDSLAEARKLVNLQVEVEIAVGDSKQKDPLTQGT